MYGLPTHENKDTSRTEQPFTKTPIRFIGQPICAMAVFHATSLAHLTVAGKNLVQNKVIPITAMLMYAVPP